LTSLVTDEISICCSWWTIEPNKASRKQPHRNTILDIHQSEQHVSLHLTEHITLWWMFSFEGIVCYSSCCSLIYWLLAWCLFPRMWFASMSYVHELLSWARSFEEIEFKITTQDHVHHHQCFSFVVKFCIVGTHPKKKKLKYSVTVALLFYQKKLRNSWFFEEMLSHFHCPHESLTTFFSVWIKNWAIF
jgi:hypothetical protein